MLSDVYFPRVNGVSPSTESLMQQVVALYRQLADAEEIDERLQAV